MKKAIAGIFTLLGAAGLIVGVCGIFKAINIATNPWIFAILGIIFFIGGMRLLNSSGE